MKLFDMVGQPIGIGSIVLSGNPKCKDAPIFRYAVVADFTHLLSKYGKLILLKPSLEGNKNIITMRRVPILTQELVNDGKEIGLKFKGLLVQPSTPETITQALYKAILHRAAKRRGNG